MGESNRNQGFSNPPSLFHIETTVPTNPAQSAVPELITKKYLAARFGLIHPSGRITYKRLYEKVLTPSVIAALNCTEQEIRNCRVKTFTRQQTLVLIQILGL